MAEILGLDTSVTQDTLAHSAALLNGLPPDTAFPTMNDIETAIDDLCNIIAAYDVQSIFQLQLMHRHALIPEDHVLLRTPTTEQLGYWTTPTHIANIDLTNIRGAMYCVDSFGNFSPTEFRAGLPYKGLHLDRQFLHEFREYLQKNAWINMFGLQVRDLSDGKMIEFSYDIGNILLPESAVKIMAQCHDAQLRTTSWRVTQEGGVVDKDGQTRCFVYPTGHYQGTKAKDVSDVLERLKSEGLLEV